MTTRGRTGHLVVMLAGLSLASLTACAGPTVTTFAGVVAERTSETPPRAASQPTASPEPTEPRRARAVGAKIAAPPVVAKKQRWVKIFSGPSLEDITPPRDKTKGSHVLELNATESAQIGTYLADGAGRTLYRFDKDTARPPKSTCNGDCATAWPPLLIKSPGKIFPNGVNPKIIGYVERADGTCQVTVNGWPVYFFAADAKPGDINGQGVNGTWFAVSPSGGRTRAIPGQLRGR